MNMEIEEMHKQRNKDASSDRILPNVIRQDAGKKSSMSWGSPFQKKIHFMHVLKLKGNYVVSFSFHQKVSSVSVHRGSKNSCHVSDKTIFRLWKLFSVAGV